MSFQLVRASENEIIIWHTEHGHVYGYVVASGAKALDRLFCREVADATEKAEDFGEEAMRFAVAEARSRKLLG